MDSPPLSPEAPVAPKRRHILRRFVIVCVCVAVVLTIVLIPLISSRQQFVWLTPSQAAQANRPGLLMQLRYKLIGLAGPLMRFYTSHKPNILVAASILTMPTGTGEAVLDAPGMTNADGQCAWILSPEQVASFLQHVRANTNVSMLSSPRIISASGVQASMTMSGHRKPYSNVGTSLDTIAKVSSGSINLFVHAEDTQPGGPPGGTNALVVTNFSVACRVRLADGYGLVINCRDTDTADALNYWLIVSPRLVDATGKPIKK